jgi:hypothetical protein
VSDQPGRSDESTPAFSAWVPPTWDEVVGGPGHAERGGAGLHEPLGLDGLGALAAGGEVLLGTGGDVGGQPAVDEGRDPRPEVRAAHDPSSPRASVRRALTPARGARCARASRSWARPRWMRERTVPSFTPSVAAISS